MVNTRFWRAALLLLCTAVAYLALSASPPPGADLGWDKLNHASAFAAMAGAAALGFKNRRWYCLWVALSLTGFGAAIEVAQLFVPGRSCEWGDLLADCVGIAVGLSIATVALRFALRQALPIRQ